MYKYIYKYIRLLHLLFVTSLYNYLYMMNTKAVTKTLMLQMSYSSRCKSQVHM